MLIYISPKLKKQTKRGQKETEGEMNLFKQMNSNEASHKTFGVGQRCEREGLDFPAGKDSAQTPEREGAKNKRRTLEKVSREEEWSSNERGEPERGGPEFKVVFRRKDCPSERLNTNFLRV